MLTLLLGMAWAFPFSVDDAFITLRYASRIARGLGYSFNPGPATDGVTGPLWLVPALLAEWGGLDAEHVLKLTGGACAIAAALMVIVRARAPQGGRAAAWALVSLLATQLPFVVWAVAGLESAAAALAFTVMALSVAASPRPRGVSLGCAIACAAWLRPEIFPAAAAALFACFLRERREAVRAFAIGAGGALALVAFRIAMFGTLLPLSAHAKPAELGHGVDYAFAAFARWPVLFALLLSLPCVQSPRPRDLALVGIVLAHVLAIVLAGGDWMPSQRLFVPMIPIACLIAARGFAVWMRRRRSLALLLLFACVSTSLLELSRELPAVREAGLNRRARVPELAQLLESRPGPVAVLDVGALGVALPQVTLFDLGGLTRPQVAYARGGHLDKRFDERVLRDENPAWVVLHSARLPEVDADGGLRRMWGYPVERRVAGFAFVREHYRVRHVFRYSPTYFYILLARSQGARGH
jgi:hypothetical protein